MQNRKERASKWLFAIMPFIAETGAITNMLLTFGIVTFVYGIYFISNYLKA